MDKLDKLDYSSWPEKERVFLESLIQVLTNLDPSQLAVHLELAAHSPTGYGDSEHIETPATYALLAYGRDGLHALGSLASGEFHQSGVTWAARALVTAALGASDVAEGHVRLSQRYLDSGAYGRLIREIARTCNDPQLQKEAYRVLSMVLRGYVTDPERRDQLGFLLSTLSLALAANKEAADKAVPLVFNLIVQSALKISEHLCHQLENLIASDLPERNYQEFFENNPALIDPLASSIVPRENLAEMFRTDFVIRRLDDEYIFVEIEKPQDHPFTDYPHPTEALSHALGQVVNWLIWLEDNIAYAQAHGFPGVHSPRGVIVMGRKTELTSPQLRMLKALNDTLNPRLQILTYDDVLQNARNVLRNIT